MADEHSREDGHLSRRGFLRSSMVQALGGALAGQALLGQSSALAEVPAHTVKFACVAPEGSLWVKLTRGWDQELRARSQNRMRIQIFPGGILGEEIDAIRKMRVGQIQATGVTGIGMGEMVASTRMLELPRLVQSTRELDALTAQLAPEFERSFVERGYVLLGFTEVGPIHLFTRAPIKKVSELNAMRMWLWDSDPVSQAISKVFGVSGVPLSLLNVMPSLQTGVIDGAYGSPLATLTMQWHNYLKYMTLQPLAYAVGVIVMDKRAFDALPADLQALQLELGKTYTRKMVEQARVDNGRALELMKTRGIQLIALDSTEETLFNQRSEAVWQALESKLYSPELLARAKGIVARARQGGANP